MAEGLHPSPAADPGYEEAPHPSAVLTARFPTIAAILDRPIVNLDAHPAMESQTTAEPHAESMPDYYRSNSPAPVLGSVTRRP